MSIKRARTKIWYFIISALLVMIIIFSTESILGASTISEIKENQTNDPETLPSVTNVYVDIKPGYWPNPINLKAQARERVFPVAVCGTEDLNVETIDLETIYITREGVEDRVAPFTWSYIDIATPYTGESGSGHDLNGDGVLDLTLKFFSPELTETLGLDGFEGESLTIILTGNLQKEYDSIPIQGQDIVWVTGAKG